MAMFPQFESMPGVPQVGGSAPLLSFKAGKMEVADKGGDKFHITPDLRKGSITLFKGPDDQLMHFAWKERPSGTVVDDIIILPEEAVYKKVDTGRVGERVFLMEIAGNRRFFYWMQDKDSEKDEENMKKVNELTNSPPSDDAPAARGSSNNDMMELLSSMGGGAGTAGLGAPAAAGSGLVSNEQGLNIQNLQSILQNMGFSPQEQAFATGDATAATPSTGTSSAAAATAATPAATPTTPADTTATPAPATPAVADPAPAGALESATPAAAAPSTPTPAAAGNSGGGGSGVAGGGGGLTAADLQRAMTSMSGMRPPPQQKQQTPTSLTTVMDVDAIEASGILDDPEVQRVLLPLLAEGQQTEEDLRDTMRSPHLQQALSSLQEALQTENFNGIMSSSGLDPTNPGSAEAMAKGDPVSAYLQATIHAAESRPQKPSGESAAQEKKGGGSGEGDESAAEETKGGGGGEGSGDGDENNEGSGAGEDRATAGA